MEYWMAAGGTDVGGRIVINDFLVQLVCCWHSLFGTPPSDVLGRSGATRLCQQGNSKADRTTITIYAGDDDDDDDYYNNNNYYYCFVSLTWNERTREAPVKSTRSSLSSLP